MLGESVENRESIKNFFDDLMQEDEINDVVGIYFTVNTLHKLGNEKSVLTRYFDMKEISRSTQNPIRKTSS